MACHQVLFDIVFQLNTELTIVVNGAETVVNSLEGTQPYLFAV